MSDDTRKHVTVVGVCGAIGGALGWGLAVWLNHPVHLSLWLDISLSVALGAGASVVFVFLLANTDRSDGARLIALALLAGFFWEPVWEAGRALVDSRIQSSNLSDAIDSVERASSLTSLYATAGPEDRDSLLQDIRVELQRAARMARTIDSVSGLERVRIASVDLLSTEVPSDEMRQLFAALYPDRGSVRRTGVAYMGSTSRWLTPILLPETMIPPRNQIPVLEIPGELRSDTVDAEIVFFRIIIDVPSRIVIETLSEHDLVAELYETSSRRHIWRADDLSSTNLNPRMTVSLESGDYLVVDSMNVVYTRHASDRWTVA